MKESEVTGGPGTVEVKVKLTKPAKRVLKDRGKVKAKTEEAKLMRDGRR